MNEQTEKVQHKDGPPWDNVRVFSTFGEADSFRKSVLQDATQQAKVKVQKNNLGDSVFVVKKRKNPALVAEEQPREKKKDKKKQ